MSLEARVARIEAHIEHIDVELADIKQDIRNVRVEIKSQSESFRGDLKWMLGLYAAGFGTLATLMAHGFHWI